ncbi:MAG: DUF898 domain-containing protein [Oxalobacter sp.]|nr:MAG: DUF898 domain-containing protein [Oxalobacter sp.]
MSDNHDFAPTVLLGVNSPQTPQLSDPPPPRTPPPFNPPPSPPASSFPSDSGEASGPERLIFTGTGGEYFRIWIVNLFLNILTLGIYSAWAKVRKMRYFYDSTHLAGSSFEYHGKPSAILKGRLIAGGLLVAYNFVPKVSIKAGYAMMLLLAVVMPWLIWKSLQFKLHNSSYRGIRFGFDGTCGRAYKVYMLYPFLSALTFGLLTPFTHQRIKKFQHDESRYGTSPFSFHASVKNFYGAYFLAFVIFVVGMLALTFLGGAFGSSILKSAANTKGKQAVFGILMAFVIFAWGQMVYSIFMTMLQNLIWNNTQLGDHAFTSDMKGTSVMYIALTNILFIALTLGLYTPFAKVRMLKYRVESMTLIPSGNLDGFVANTAAEVSATSEGVTDLLDFDFAL